MSEMSSGGPPGRSRPPAIESVKAKLYWGDHFGEPAKIDHVGGSPKINNSVKCGYKKPKMYFGFTFLGFRYGPLRVFYKKNAGYGFRKAPGPISASGH